jgi:hypothetical protein
MNSATISKNMKDLRRKPLSMLQEDMANILFLSKLPNHPRKASAWSGNQQARLTEPKNKKRIGC